MANYTPGPWAIRGGKSELPQVWDSGFDNCITDRVFNGNAALIAAAPDLLEACRDALEDVLLWHRGHTSLTVSGCKARIAQLHAAIAKAEGRS